MRCVIQRVKSAEVSVDGCVAGKIGRGLLVLCAFCAEDTEEKIAWVARRTASMRIFNDENGKLNRSAVDIGGEILCISNFTLYGDCLHGTRPDFGKAAKGEISRPMYDLFCSELKKYLPVQTGKFGEHMETKTETDGPITAVLEK